MLAALPQKVHFSIRLLRQTPPLWFLHAAKRHTCCCWISEVQTPNTRQRRRLHPLPKAGRTAVGLAEEPEPEDFPPQSLTNFASGTPRRTSRTAEKPIVQKLQERIQKEAAGLVKTWKPSLQLLQLVAVVTLLIEVPAALSHVPSGGRVQQLTLLYLAFFGLGSVIRLWVHGKLTPRRQDAQVQTRSGVLSLIMFIILIVAGQ